MAKWKRQRLRLKQDHAWKTRSDYQIIVVDRGAVRLDVPRTWVMTMKADEKTGSTTLTVTDRRPPKDDCRLQVTAIYAPRGIDWSGLPLTRLLEQSMSGPDERKLLGRSLAVLEQRRELELAWIETRYVDPGENREARSRTCLARRAEVHVLLTLDYWPEDAGRFLPIWDEILSSLRLGEYIQDPTRGPGH